MHFIPTIQTQTVDTGDFGTNKVRSNVWSGVGGQINKKKKTKKNTTSNLIVKIFSFRLENISLSYQVFSSFLIEIRIKKK